MKDVVAILDFSGKAEPREALALCMGDTNQLCGPQKPFVAPAFLVGGLDDNFEDPLFSWDNLFNSPENSFHPANIWNDD